MSYLYYYHAFIIGNLSYNNNIIIKMNIKSNAYQALELLNTEQSLGLVYTFVAIAVGIVDEESYGYNNR
ncbi:MAG: hypothetical protein M3M88_06160 [Thermoproteota archaeon]|nr:hypothetical protein [Thermoproteota archaeon]